MNYLFKLFCLITLARFTVAQTEYVEDDPELTTQPYIEEGITSAYKTFTISREKHLDSSLELEPEELEKVKSAGFYSLIEHNLYRHDTLKKYPRRIECIIETLKKKNAISEISTDDMNEKFEILETTNSSIVVTFKDANGFKDDIEMYIESANSSCFLPGIVSVTILASILMAIISLVICTNKNNPIPSEA